MTAVKLRYCRTTTSNSQKTNFSESSQRIKIKFLTVVNQSLYYKHSYFDSCQTTVLSQDNLQPPSQIYIKNSVFLVFGSFDSCKYNIVVQNHQIWQLSNIQNCHKNYNLHKSVRFKVKCSHKVLNVLSLNFWQLSTRLSTINEQNVTLVKLWYCNKWLDHQVYIKSSVILLNCPVSDLTSNFSESNWQVNVKFLTDVDQLLYYKQTKFVSCQTTTLLHDNS